MAKKGPRSPILDALRLAWRDERLAVEFMERHRWGDESACPKCGSFTVYKMCNADGGRNKDYRWRCRGCKKMFTVRTGTVMEETRLPVRAWVYAFWKACSSKKGVSAMQIHRETEISYKSALFLMHRIRHAMGSGSGGPKMTGTIEADETYVGGKPRNRRPGKPGPRPLDDGGKVPVIGILERGGRIRYQMMERITARKLADAIRDTADRGSRLMTDDANAYDIVGREFAGGHFTTDHSRREYAKPGTDIHSNTIESAFSLIKRGVYGTFHSISRKHLPKYLNEFEFRWCERYAKDDERVIRAIKSADGKRLTYRAHVGA